MALRHFPEGISVGGQATAPLAFIDEYGKMSVVACVSSGVIKAASGTSTAPSIAFNADNGAGLYYSAADDAVLVVNGGVKSFFVTSTVVGIQDTSVNFVMNSTASFGWSSTNPLGSGPDTILARDAANVLAMKNSTTAQEVRVYGTTTGPKYVSLKHDGTDGIVDTAASSGNLKLGGNASGIQWMKAVVALGGGAAPTVGTIGGSGPAVAAQNSWLPVILSDGSTGFLGVWK